MDLEPLIIHIQVERLVKLWIISIELKNKINKTVLYLFGAKSYS